MNEYYKQQVEEWLENRGKFFRCKRCKVMKPKRDILHDGLCVDCIGEENDNIERATKSGDL